MPLNPREHVPLAPLTTFGIGGPARYFHAATSETEVAEAFAWAVARGLPVFVLGGGSNLLVPDAGYPGLVLSLAANTITGHGHGLLEADAGVVWDTFVDHALTANLAGVECLAGIPGSVGGTPVQNVGAYGQEVAETIVRVHALDRDSRAFVDLDHAACRFRYRESLFNTDQPGRYVVTRVWFQLRHGGAPTLKYADLQRLFGPGAQPSLAEVAAAVRAIRRTKGMLLVPGDPDTRSAGSYFRNPIVPAGQLERIAAAANVAPAAVPHWPVPGDPARLKLAAAWLLERAGFVKGFRDGAVGISSRHTLALVNLGGATFADVARLEAQIVAGVQAKFGVALVREPVILA